MRYYYFNPFSKQYYFPEGFKAITLFNSFYQPYTIAGKLLWFIWNNISIVRHYCSEASVEKILPMHHFKKHVAVNALLAINTGTKGVEQKMSILAYDPVSGNEFFMKYAESKIARKNVDNEGKVLAQLIHLDFVPKLQQHIVDNNYTLIKTDVLKGERYVKQQFDAQVLDVLFQLSNQNVNSVRKLETELKCCFAHGDFCPWNMMLNEGKLFIYDWEMAGTYSLGYDLFTFIFQTSFLLSPKKNNSKLLKQNIGLIESYFKSFEIINWKEYLIEFITIKLNLESQKGNQSLIFPYQILKKDVEKI